MVGNLFFERSKRISLTLLALMTTVPCITPAGSQTAGKSKAPSAAPKETPFKIGFIASLSGVGAMGGKDMVNGIKLFLEQKHYKLGGRQVELIVENDESNPTKALEKLRKLAVDDKVQIVAGVTFSHIAYAIAPKADELKIPLIIAVPGADDLTQRTRHPWVVRTSFTSSQSSQPFGDWVRKTRKYKKIDIISVDFPYGWESAGGFQRAFELDGGEVVQRQFVPLGFTDFSHFIKKLRPDVDAVYMVGIAGSAAALSKQYDEMGPKLPLLAAGATFEESSLRHMGDEALNATSAVIYSAALETPANRKFVEEYRAKYEGDDPSQFSEGAYTSGMFIEKAAESVKGKVEDGGKLLNAVKHAAVTNAPRGPVKLDEYGNPVENVYIANVTRINGRLENKVLQTLPNVSQFWNIKPSEYLSLPPFSSTYPACKYCPSEETP